MLIFLSLAVHTMQSSTGQTEPTDPYELSLGNETMPEEQPELSSLPNNTTPTNSYETSFAQAPDQTQYDSLSPQYFAPSPYDNDLAPETGEEVFSPAYYSPPPPPPYIEAFAPEEYSSPYYVEEEPLAPEPGTDNSLSPQYSSPPAMAPETETDDFYEAPVPAPSMEVPALESDTESSPALPPVTPFSYSAEDDAGVFEDEPEVSTRGNGGTLSGIVIGVVCVVGLGGLVYKKRSAEYKYQRAKREEL